MQYIQVSDSLKNHIVRNLIEPSYKQDIETMIKQIKRAKYSGHMLETISKILVSFGTIVSFSSGYYTGYSHMLSFISGCISTVSLTLLHISSFAYKESRKQTSELNILLQKMGLESYNTTDLNNSHINIEYIESESDTEAST
uniref:SMODS and SLOG-associating 2TM effector domain-containing protein n=1 Tax=viral metagenome TaxID=1070528 RepID=A0A6C0H8G2_9ZZZZ